jgi:nucleotide-binding universal stress UspA family protein
MTTDNGFTKRVLVAVDHSDGSRAAVEEGVRLAGVLGAAVTFVSVSRAPAPLLGDPYYQRAVGKALREARAVLGAAMDVAERNGVRADYELLEGDPADQIVELARRRDVNIVVVGSRGLGAVSGALLGSVSSVVARRAGRPVLVAKPQHVSEKVCAA